MAKVKVYRVKKYDINTDEYIQSRRMATLAGAKCMGGVIDATTETEIDESMLEAGEQWTARDFDPERQTGFQQRMRK